MALVMASLLGCTESWEEGSHPHNPDLSQEEVFSGEEKIILDGGNLKAAAPILSSVLQEYGQSLEIYRSAKDSSTYYYLPDQLQWKRDRDEKIRSNVFIMPRPLPKDQHGIPLQVQEYQGVLGYELELVSSPAQRARLQKFEKNINVIALPEADVFERAFVIWERELLPEKDVKPSIFERVLLPFKQDFSRLRWGNVLSSTLELTKKAALDFKIFHELASRNDGTSPNVPMAKARYCVDFRGLTDVFLEDSSSEFLRYRNRKYQEARACTHPVRLSDLIPRNVIYEEVL